VRHVTCWERKDTFPSEGDKTTQVIRVSGEGVEGGDGGVQGF